MSEGYWVIRTYESGQVGEKTKYFIQGQRPPKGTKRIKSDLKKVIQNEYSAMKNLARLINANFIKGDILLGLDYSEAGLRALEQRARGISRKRLESGLALEDAEAEHQECMRLAADQEIVNFFRRIKSALPFSDIKYAAITSDMDGETGESVRLHHHLVISSCALEVCKIKWPHGDVHWDMLSGQLDYTPVAEYLIRQVRHVPDAKKYKTSRNLVRPQPKDRIAVGGSELRPPKGCALLHRNEFRPGRPQYIRYLLAPYGAQGGATDKNRASDIIKSTDPPRGEPQGRRDSAHGL